MTMRHIDVSTLDRLARYLRRKGCRLYIGFMGYKNKEWIAVITKEGHDTVTEHGQSMIDALKNAIAEWERQS